MYIWAKVAHCLNKVMFYVWQNYHKNNFSFKNKNMTEYCKGADLGVWLFLSFLFQVYKH